jgi:hypothetical protein
VEAVAAGGGDGAGMGTAAVCSPVALMMRDLPFPLSITPRRKRGEGTLDLAGALLLVVALLVDTDGIKRGVGARGTSGGGSRGGAGLPRRSMAVGEPAIWWRHRPEDAAA